MAIPVLRSLTLKQAIHAVLAAFVIGLTISTAEFAWTATRERTMALAQVEDMVALVEGPAATAAWLIDGELAGEVLQGMVRASAAWAEIRLGDGTLLARRERPAKPPSLLERAATALLFIDRPVVTRDLTTPASGTRAEVGAAGVSRIGRLTVGIDTGRAASAFLAYVSAALVAGTLRNLLIGLAMAAVFHRLLTRPLLQIGRAVARIDPEKPYGQPLTVPRGHADDELGFVIARFNHTLTLLEREHDELRRLATRCPLTGLANRALLLDRLDHAIELANRAREPDAGRLAVLYVDLDRFKRVNDSLGHGVGDLLLCRVAERLGASVRRCDTVGRLGGDEFLVVLERVADRDEAAMVAQRLLDDLSTLREVGDHRVHLTASIGIAVHPTEGNGKAPDSTGLMRMADSAMQAAKAAGGDRFVFYTRDMTDRAETRLRLESGLREAVAARSFELVYQPKIEAASGRLTGFEALIRWRHDGAAVSPADFIPVAEDTGLIIEIGRWVLEEACRTATRWALDHGPVPVAVNVSARQLADPGFARLVEQVLQRHGTPAHLLELEITETVIMKDVRHHLPTLNRLRALGVRIAIDDFGTGYSSLAYLRQLPVDVLKIDRSFVNDLPHAPDIASTVIALAQRLLLSTVAEGVETAEQRHWLAEAGCDCLQGYLISRPLAAEAAEAMVMTAFARNEALALTA
ncbi:diguanylate cyclase (GGDEF)-like protein [Azospirillum lipoferum]|uniref:EAL domain-containing protein n=1 Tax=Azospirillum lipoferum TaxID=193 RepID=A0A5A9GQ65_AZOLI|nr:MULTISPECIES: bifunctional diguanylate cyclase/phosphodiesterase [Azospirillum]KAA0596513.1 EAL domain-containing protein [Azospirillum lipoferum]MCP1610511.1 diguanylate cyclase (GGDEF)-like protein [Azospirillum lipoferum]MDW5538044.1 EAL domain-containing protein [Azospirillum sp. NL1]